MDVSTDTEIRIMLEQIRTERAETKANKSAQSLELLKWLIPLLVSMFAATAGIIIAVLK